MKKHLDTKITTRDLVSVIIPTYNHSEFVKKALQSVIDQTYTNWEAIVIDNHSDDNTDSVINSFADPRIKLLKIHNNGVIAASRNVGIQHAGGVWVAFLDSDDWWYPKKLDRCIQELERGYDLICHGEVWLNIRDDVRNARNIFYGPESRAIFQSLLFNGNCISTSAVVVRRHHLEMVSGFDESPNMVTAEDYHLWLKLSRAGAHIGFLNELLGEYLIHDGNSSKTILHNMNALRTVFEKIYSEIKIKPVRIRILAHRRRAIIDYSGARGFQSNGEYKNAWKLLFSAIVKWPIIPKFYAALLLNIIRKNPLS
jgi:teichuronic acid biosynthesis glycosyltransferase TuaG